MRSIFFSFISLLLFASLCSALDPDKLVLDTFDEVKNKLKNKADISEEQLDRELKEMVDEIFDFKAMARSSLSSNWNKATPAQQSEYLDLFSDLLFNTYVNRIKDGIGDAKIKLEGVLKSKQGDKAIVKTKVDNGKEVAEIQYRMKNKNGEWRIYDVVVENIGLVSNYRSEFSAIIRKDKMAGLLEKLRDKKKNQRKIQADGSDSISDISLKL